ncbi:MAG: hypothetical protein HFJ66_08390 [Eggerthellaceae bacterium]|nr:hypothetical protein [Eggerthellaceae bacterium]
MAISFSFYRIGSRDNSMKVPSVSPQFPVFSFFDPNMGGKFDASSLVDKGRSRADHSPLHLPKTGRRPVAETGGGAAKESVDQRT